MSTTTTTTEIRQTLTGTWQLDPVHSSVGFEVPYLEGITDCLITEDVVAKGAPPVLTCEKKQSA